MAVMPGAEPLSLNGGPVGFLLCHGFTGTTASLRPWATELAEAGISVEVPRLPGHGTHWRDLNRTSWRDWYHTVERAFSDLSDRCPVVFVGGLSMGGALALRLAQRHANQISGLVLVNPAVLVQDWRLKMLPVLRRLTESVPGVGGDIADPGVSELCYDRTPLHALSSMLDLFARVRRDLPEVLCPVVVAQSTNDHVVPAASSRMILDQISSLNVQHVPLPNSFHVATLDYDALLIVEASLQLVKSVLAAKTETNHAQEKNGA